MNDSKIKDILNRPEVLNQLNRKGITTEQLLNQIERFRTGFPAMNVLRPCTVGDGIHRIDGQTQHRMIKKYLDSLGTVSTCKFVPASGAATRMFRDLLTECNKLKVDMNHSADLPATNKLVKNIDRFAFYHELRERLRSNGYQLDELAEAGEYLPILDTLLESSGMNYGNLPKGLIKFHRYGKNTRTAFEEHLAEAGKYLVNERGDALIHFTVPEKYKDDIAELINEKKKEHHAGAVEYHIEYSVQKESTDTVAVDKENVPVTVDSGRLVFRPGGHGALLENLDSVKADIVFIKNIDNVLVERYLENVSFHKMILAGYLISLQKKIFNYLQRLEKGDVGEDFHTEIEEFCNKKLYIDISKLTGGMDTRGKQQQIFDLLNRPVRVCGVVKNRGEPGGGPFWTEKDGTESIQIVESAQIDMYDPGQKGIWESSTHFNPVDLVCGVKNYRGEKFSLKQFVDKEAGIITKKSLDGKDIKALELPGLWNGSMSDWLTAFVEVPIETFSPVKTVFDLLREEHQGDLR